MDTNTFNDIMRMPCLGRDLDLGSLYDCCTDQIVISKSIWDAATIHGAQLEHPSNKDPIEYTVWVLNNIDNKARCLEIDGELYLSCAAGHMKLKGEANFFCNNVHAKNVIRLALKCYSSSKIIQLEMKMLNSDSVSIETFEQESATHIVTGIEYGAISIIVCDQEALGKDDIQNTYENLKTKINYLQRCISGNFPEMFSNVESNSENFTCKVFSTLHFKNEIKTYEDAVRLCKDLFKLHANVSDHMPIAVSLYPLKKIKDTFIKCARNIKDIDMIDKVKTIHNILLDNGLDLKICKQI